MYVEPPVHELQNRTQTFADDFLIRASQGLTRVVHPIARHSGGPVVQATLPCEGVCLYPIAVVHDKRVSQWRMWYGSFGVRQGSMNALPQHTLHVAVSDDAVTWRKPSLGLVKDMEGQENNICVWEDGSAVARGVQLFHEPDEPDAQKRYKLILYRPDYYLAYSADGLRWRMAQDAPVWPNGSGDGLEETSFMFRDPLSQRYRAYMRVWRRTQTIRMNGLGESEDLIHWTGPKICFSAQTGYGLGAQVYGMNVHVDSGVYWGLPWMLYTQESFDQNLQESIRFKLAMSRDGWSWSPVAPEVDILPMGEREKEFDWGMVLSQCPVVQIGNVNHFYYCGMNGLHYPENPPTSRSVGLGTWPQGRLVGLKADDEGLLLTQRFILRGRSIHLNARAAEGGFIQAELLRDGGSVMAGCTFKNSIPFTGDEHDAALQWRGVKDLSQCIGQSVMLRLKLHKAEVFSFRVHASEEDEAMSNGPLPLVIGRCVAPPVIDGVLDESCWQDFTHSGVTSPFSKFTQIEPAQVQTRVTATYDDRHLYLAMECHEPLSDKLPTMPPDGPVRYAKEETIDLRLSDPALHGKHVHQFLITSTGRGDHHFFTTEGGGNTPNFPGAWSCKVVPGRGKWVVEMAIPFETLSSPLPELGTKWKLNIIRFRHIAGEADHSCWSCMFGGQHRNDLAGTLVFS